MSLFSGLGNLNVFGAGGANSGNASASKGAINNEWVLYGIVILFCVIVVFTLLGKTIDFKWISWFDVRPADWKVKARSSLFFQPGPQFTNMVVLASKAVQGMENDIYSILFDFVLYDSRNYASTEGPYRQLLHRGSSELLKATVGGAVLGGCSTNPSGDLPPFGLPKRLNPGVFLDPNTNDILIFVDTVKGSDTLRESVRISDIPLDIPTRIGIVLNKRVLEVYLNCRLETTKVLQGDPKRVENEWYGIAGTAAAKAQLQNLYAWKESLSSDDMKVLCPAPPVFPTTRPICSGADEPLPPKAVGKPTGSLGIASSLSTCGK